MSSINLSLLKSVNTVVAEAIEIAVEKEGILAKLAGMSDDALQVILDAGDIPEAYETSNEDEKAELKADFAVKLDLPNDDDEEYIEELYPALLRIVFATAKRIKQKRAAADQGLA